MLQQGIAEQNDQPYHEHVDGEGFDHRQAYEQGTHDGSFGLGLS